MDTQKNIMASIVDILTNNGLTELSLGDYDELHDPAYIVWFDDDGSPYDDPVIKVMVEDNTVSVEVEAREFANNVTLQDYEINRPEWWQQIHASVLEVLERDGKRRCPVCGKILKGRQKYCSEPCRKLAEPKPTAQEVAELANKRIRELIGKIIEYESLVHAGECLDSECHNGKKDCTGRSCKRCRKRYYAKIKKQLIEKYSIKV